MNNCILFNPRCSKCRQTMTLLDGKNIELEVIEYLKETPAVADLQFICTELKVHPLEICRTGEKRFRELNLSKKDRRSEEEWLQIMADNPILIERPIIVYNNKVVIGRPPEKVLDIL